MSSINGSSRKIIDVISVVDGIGPQSNLPVLNVAVVAVRADEQGRGLSSLLLKKSKMWRNAQPVPPTIRYVVQGLYVKEETG